MMMQQDVDQSNKILVLWSDGFSFAQIAVSVGLTKIEVSQHIYKMRVGGVISPRPEKRTRPTIMELRYGQCRYVVGTHPEDGTLFCGDQTHKGSYCLPHHSLCYKGFPRRT
jgi:hypothetical protein